MTDFLKIVKDETENADAVCGVEIDVSFINDMTNEEIGKAIVEKYGKIMVGGWLYDRDYSYPFGATLDEMDIEAYFNMRGWLENAVRKNGGEVTGGGIGMGSADIDIEIEGAPYNVVIKPRPLYKKPEQEQKGE